MARKRNRKEEEQKQLLIYKAQYEMHLKTLEEAKLRGKTDSQERMEMIIQDDIQQMAKIDKAFADKCIAEAKNKANGIDFESIASMDIDDGDIISRLGAMDEKDGVKEDTIEDKFIENMTETGNNEESEELTEDLYAMADKIDDSFEQSVDIAKEEVRADDTIYNNIDPNAQYDLIKLPSKGECYRDKTDKVPVGYLTAADENLITSPNLYESGSITNILLKRKVLNSNINIDNLVSGDVDAIMVFLRGTSYGNMFPIVAQDPVSQKKIETEVDLQTLSYKPFTLKGDENGHFDYTMPLTKAKIKFKFLTKGEEKLLQKLNKNENKGIVGFELNNAVEKINNALKEDNTLSDAEKNIIIDAKKKLETWASKANKKNAQPYTMTVTNSLEMQIVSVNGNTDRKFIHNFVMNMPASDSLSFRRYIYDNQPGVDFKVKVQRPESMGGGSFDCFLEWDDTVFWNISDVSTVS